VARADSGRAARASGVFRANLAVQPGLTHATTAITDLSPMSAVGVKPEVDTLG
jgi:hypothetical protein